MIYTMEVLLRNGPKSNTSTCSPKKTHLSSRQVYNNDHQQAQMNARVSVIIPTKGRLKEVVSTLKSLYDQSFLPSEVLVIDGSPHEKLRAELKWACMPLKGKIDVKYLRSKASLTHQRNIGIKASIGDIVIFFDDDVSVDKNYIKEVLEVFSSDPSIGAITGKVNIKYYDIERFYESRIFRSIYEFFATAFFLQRRGDGRFLPSGLCTVVRSDERVYVEFLCGNNMAFRRRVFNEFVFDESLSGGMRGEDEDFAYRLSRKYRIVYTPYANVTHKSVSIAANRYVMRDRIKNHFYLFKKNMPQRFKNKLAFYLSIVGKLFFEIAIMVATRRKEGFKGLVHGIADAIS